MKRTRLSLSIVVGLALMLAPPVLADFQQAGKDALIRGDYGTALKEFRPLAEQGHPLAQANLGLLYAEGQGVPQDDVLAHMWMNLAAAKGVQEAVKGRDLLEKNMTPAQIGRAQRLARDWKAKGK